MSGEGEELERKRVAPLSTVSLDSTYDNDDGGSTTAEKRPLQDRCSWTPFVVMVGLVLIAVGLVLALDRGNSERQGVVAEGDPVFSTAHSLWTSGEGLTAPQKKLVEWLKQIRNASELYVEGGSSNMSLTGVLFPQYDSDTSLPFDAMVVIDSGITLPTRQYVALANGRGFKWAETSLGYGDSITTNGCLTVNQTLPFDELDSVVATANWTSLDDNSDLNVVFNGENYMVSKEEEDNDDYFDSIDTDDDTRCWLVESEDEDFGLRVCIPSLGDLFPKTEFAELFNATNGCPQLAPNTTRMKIRTQFSVPLPLRKWYASYEG